MRIEFGLSSKSISMSDHRRMEIGAMLNNDEEENCLVRPAHNGIQTEDRNPFSTGNPSPGNGYSHAVLTIRPVPAPYSSSMNFDRKLSVSTEETCFKEDRETESSISPHSHSSDAMEGPMATRLPPMRLELPTYHRSKFAPSEANPTILPPIQLAVPWASYYPSSHCDNPEHSYHACDNCWSNNEDGSRIFYCCHCYQLRSNQSGYHRLQVVFERLGEQNRAHLWASRQHRSSCSPRTEYQSHPRQASFPSTCEPQPLPRRRRSPNQSGIGRNKQPYSNKPYNREQVHSIRYFKVDCEKKFEEIVDIWLGIWPHERPLTHQSVSSRGYRDNIRPLCDENGDLVVIDGNKVIMVSCKIREKNMPENKHIPDTLVGRHPDMVLKYSWTSQKHKDDARVLMVEDAAKPNSKGAVCRKLLKLWNDALIDKENKVVGRPTDSYSFLILLKNKNKEIERLCDCKAAEKLRGHSDCCRVWEHPTMKRCSCRHPIRSLTTHHLPECGSHSHRDPNRS